MGDMVKEGYFPVVFLVAVLCFLVVWVGALVYFPFV
uniref:Uncharacterized protein n=1 Tax=Anguilla anguilla TaxID=7936 RepID=A0A0E9SB14_ANGAN